ncbi:MAG: hypothetical protein CMI16_03080 [Opitutaceae bacterium]|nr:hypothetical protein [Opitutaceae bacterium]
MLPSLHKLSLSVGAPERGSDGDRSAKRPKRGADASDYDEEGLQADSLHPSHVEDPGTPHDSEIESKDGSEDESAHRLSPGYVEDPEGMGHDSVPGTPYDSEIESGDESGDESAHSSPPSSQDDDNEDERSKYMDDVDRDIERRKRGQMRLKRMCLKKGWPAPPGTQQEDNLYDFSDDE